MYVYVFHVVDAVQAAARSRPAIAEDVAPVYCAAGGGDGQVQVVDEVGGGGGGGGVVAPDQCDFEGAATAADAVLVNGRAVRRQACCVIHILVAAIGGICQINLSPALMHIGDGIVIIIHAVIVFIQQVNGRIYQRRLHQRCTGRMGIRLLVKVTYNSRAASRNGVRHGRAAHIFVLAVIRVTIAIILPGIVLRVWRAIIPLLVQVRIAGKNPTARCNNVWLDTAVIRWPPAGESGHLLGIARAGVIGNGVGRIITRPGCSPGKDVIHTPLCGAVCIAQTGITREIVRAGIFTGAHADDIFSGGRRPHRIAVDDAVAVGISARVACGKGDGHIWIVPDKLVGLCSAVGV